MKLLILQPKKEEDDCPEDEFFTLKTFLDIGKTEISEIVDDKTEEISKGQNKDAVDIKSKGSAALLSRTLCEDEDDETTAQEES